MIKHLPNEWGKILGNNYHIKECGGSGDCLFHVFATALNDKIGIQGVYNAKTVRNDIANRLDTLQYPYTWNHYLDLYHAFDPPLYNDVNTLEEFQELIRTMGSRYEGDHVALSMLSQFYEANVILLNSHETSFYCWANEEKYDHYIIIWYTNRIHYQIIGFENKEDTEYNYWFTSQTIPTRLLKIWRSFYKKYDKKQKDDLEYFNNSDKEELYKENTYALTKKEKNLKNQKEQMEEYRIHKAFEYHKNREKKENDRTTSKDDFCKMVTTILSQKERDRMFYPYQKGDILLFINKPHQLQRRHHCRWNEDRDEWKCKRLDEIKENLIYKNKKQFETYLQDPNEFYIK